MLGALERAISVCECQQRGHVSPFSYARADISRDTVPRNGRHYRSICGYTDGRELCLACRASTLLTRGPSQAAREESFFPVSLWSRAMSSEARRRRFEELARQHEAVLMRAALRLTGSPAEAEDLCQETLIKAYVAFDQFTRGRRPLSFRSDPDLRLRCANPVHAGCYRPR